MQPVYCILDSRENVSERRLGILSVDDERPEEVVEEGPPRVLGPDDVETRIVGRPRELLQ